MKTIRYHLRTLKQYADAAMMLSANHMALFAPAVIISGLFVGLVVKHFKPELGEVGSLMVFIIGSLLAMACISYAIICPMQGFRIMKKIEADFGPKTRARVWEFVLSNRELEVETLSIERTAWECGEISTSQARR